MQTREGGDLIARGRREVEAEEVLVEGALRELRLREGLLGQRLRALLLRPRQGRGGGTRSAHPSGAAAPSGPTESRRNTAGIRTNRM
jgi:hypothetical protein